MQQLNRFGEPVHRTTFPTWPAARRFARMIAANVKRFALLGVRAECDFWVVTYRSRSASPWKRDPRATKGVIA